MKLHGICGCLEFAVSVGNRMRYEYEHLDLIELFIALGYRLMSVYIHGFGFKSGYGSSANHFSFGPSSTLLARMLHRLSLSRCQDSFRPPDEECTSGRTAAVSIDVSSRFSHHSPTKDPSPAPSSLCPSPDKFSIHIQTPCCICSASWSSPRPPSISPA